MPDFLAESQRTMNKSEKSLSMFSFEFIQNLDNLLRHLNRNLISLPPITSSSNISMKLEKWFGRENIIDDLNRIHNLNNNDPGLIIETMALIIVNRLVKGERIELFESRFLRDIIDRYGIKRSTSESAIHSSFSNENLVIIDQYGLARLLNDLHIGGLINQSNHESTVTRHREHRSAPHENHHNHQVKFLMNSIENNDDPIEKNIECYEYDFYVERIRQIQHHMKHRNDAKNSSEVNLLTEKELEYLAPIFLQQILSKACERIMIDSGNDDNGVIKRKISHERLQSESSHHFNHADDKLVEKMENVNNISNGKLNFMFGI